MRRGVILLIVCGLTISGRGVSRAQSRPVGPLGDPARIQVVGVKSFPPGKVVEALLGDFDVAYAAFPDAPLAELERLLVEKTCAGLKNSGFPSPRASVVDRLDHLELIVREGPRWAAGDIEIIGARASDVGKLREGLAPGSWRPNSTSTAKKSDWTIGKPAQLGEPNRRYLSRRVAELLAEQGYPAATFSVRILGRPDRGAANLQIIVENEGPPLRLEHVRFAGAKLNSREQILAYLQMPAETVLSAEVRRKIESRLNASGRFTRCKFKETSKDSPPQFVVEEFAEAPRLDEPLTPEENALLKLASWIGAFHRQNKELVYRTELDGDWLEVTMSPRDGCAALVETHPRDSESFDLAVFLSEQQAGIYSTNSGRKLASKTLATPLTANAQLTLIEGPPNGRGGGELSLGAGFSGPAKKGRKPHCKIEPTLTAAAALSVIRKHHARCQWEGPILIAKWKDYALRVDSRDGRLIELRAAKKRSWLRWWKPDKEETTIATVDGHFRKRLAQIEQATTDLPNVADVRRPASCLFEFLCEEPLARLLLDDEETPLLSAIARLSHRGVFRALDDFILTRSDETQDEFLVPADGETYQESWRRSKDLIARLKLLMTYNAIDWSNALFARGSRPWLVWRETAFIASGKSKYLHERLTRLFPAPNDGPLTDLALAEAMNGVGMTAAARTWAQRGLERLTVEAFRRDYADFLNPASLASRYLLGMVEALRALEPAEAKAVCKYLSGERWVSKSDAQGVQHFLEELRADPDRTAPEALSAALDELWRSTLERKVAQRLRVIGSVAAQPEEPSPQVRRRRFFFR